MLKSKFKKNCHLLPIPLGSIFLIVIIIYFHNIQSFSNISYLVHIPSCGLQKNIFLPSCWLSRNKSFFLVARPIRGGCKGLSTEKK